MEPIWRVALFDGPRLLSADGTELRRFRSQRVAALLAYLCLHLGRDCPREALAEALWPDEDLPLTANRLRVSLTSLRHQLELPGTPPGSVLDASRAGYVRLRSESVWCDVSAFEHALKYGNSSEAAQLACGPLLPGFYDEWILTERERLEALRESLPLRSASPVVLPAPENTVSIERRLPVALTRFFGRETEREALAEALREGRLVSLIGLGGMGKSRLSLETASRFALPCAFVPLADLSDEARLAEFVLRALGVVAQAEGDPNETLGTLLVRRGPFLLLLDNAEHLEGGVAALAVRLLEQAPELRLLITSRQPLGILGERVIALEPLELPLASATPERLQEFPVVALFCDRARHVRPDFTLTPRHTSALIAICQKLEGMPLALELAAARIRTQTPTQIATALDASILTLTTNQRGLPERHRSLRAVIQSSVDLLEPALRTFFYALSVFQGGWTSEAAEAVTQCPRTELFLDELAHRSLITLREDEHSGMMRFGYLETLRQFAAEHCTEKSALAQRHTTYFLALASLGDEHDVRTLDPLESELENLELTLSCGWASQRDDAFWDGLRGFLTFAFVRGHQRRATVWAERVVENWHMVEPPERRFELLHRTLMLYNDLGRWEEIDSLAEALRTEAQQCGLLRWAVEALEHLAYTASQRFRHEEAVALQRQALMEAQALGDRRTLIRALVSTNRIFNPLANQLILSDPERSQALYREAEAASREAFKLESAYSRYQSNIHMGLYISVGAQGRYEEAYALLKKSQDYAWRLQAMALLMYSFYFEQSVERELGSPVRAALLYGAFLRLREQMGFVHPSTAEEETWRERLRALLKPEVYDQQLRLAYQLPLATLVVPRTWNELLAGKTSPKILH